MKFMTDVHWSCKAPLLGTAERFFLLGSCFSGEFARRLEDFGEKYCLNPFGTLYDPLSMARCLSILENPAWTPSGELFHYRDLWRHPDFHTLAAGPEESGAGADLLVRQKEGRKAWGEATAAVFTFGTAFSYFHRSTGRGWANCHTLPGTEFRREMASPEEMAQVWIPHLEGLKARGTRVFFTLSPVRHLRDAPWENSLSKAALRLFIHQLETRELGIYFPAYEILLDELRDYRWYADDLVHPSSQAGDYITGKFWEAAAGRELKQRAEACSALKREFRHVPRHPSLPQEASRMKAVQQRWEALVNSYPGWTPAPPDPGREAFPGNGTGNGGRDY